MLESFITEIIAAEPPHAPPSTNTGSDIISADHVYPADDSAPPHHHTIESKTPKPEKFNTSSVSHADLNTERSAD